MLWVRISIGERTNMYAIQNSILATQSYAGEILRPRIVLYAAAISDSIPLIPDFSLQRTYLKWKQYSI